VNSSPVLQLVTQQLLYVLPTLLVCGLGGVLGLLTYGRSRLAGMLMVAGGVMLAGLHFVRFAAQAVIMNSEHHAAVQGRWLSMVGLFTSVLGAIALALLFVAAYVGRAQPDKSVIEQ